MRASSAIVEPASSSRRTWSLNSLVNVRRVRRRGLEVGMGLLSRASQLNFLYQFWVASPSSNMRLLADQDVAQLSLFNFVFLPCRRVPCPSGHIPEQLRLREV